MFLLKLTVVFLYVCCREVTAHASSEEFKDVLTTPIGQQIIKSAFKRLYNENKLTYLTNIIKAVRNQTENITLVGSQAFYGTDGRLTEVRTIELHLPVFSSPDNAESDENETSLGDIKLLRTNLFSEFGFPLSIDSVSYEGEDVGERVHLDRNFLYYYTFGNHFVNKTIAVESIDEFEQQLAELQKVNSQVSVHRFDDDGVFVGNGSHIVPEHVVKIYEAEGEVTLEILDEILKGASKLILKHGSDHTTILKNLADYLKSKFPTNHFLVSLEEPEGWFANANQLYKVSLSYDLTESEYSEDAVYTIFAFEQQNVTD